MTGTSWLRLWMFKGVGQLHWKLDSPDLPATLGCDILEAPAALEIEVETSLSGPRDCTNQFSHLEGLASCIYVLSAFASSSVCPSCGRVGFRAHDVLLAFS